ncbi:MAG: hypothetical protein D3905_06530, partial [Candidatus Electrothrix sp. AS4_5]|nr:hypothetical protein [Candidatus Electrothrix gigas]
MGETLQELEKIRYYYCSGDYTKTYEALVKLCCDNPECENFLDKKDVEKYPSIKQFQLSVMLNKHFFRLSVLLQLDVEHFPSGIQP